MLALCVGDPELRDVRGFLALRGDRRDEVTARETERHRRAREIVDVEVRECRRDDGAVAIDARVMHEREVRGAPRRRSPRGACDPPLVGVTARTCRAGAAPCARSPACSPRAIAAWVARGQDRGTLRSRARGPRDCDTRDSAGATPRRRRRSPRTTGHVPRDRIDDDQRPELAARQHVVSYEISLDRFLGARARRCLRTGRPRDEVRQRRARARALG